MSSCCCEAFGVPTPRLSLTVGKRMTGAEMLGPREIRLGGYGPADSAHSRGLDLIAEDLRAALGDAVVVSIDYNILDRGRQAQDLLRDVEKGVTTLCYFSSSYLADRVPEIGIIDLPYLFDSLAQAHRCLDGRLGSELSERTRAATGFVPLGYWDNGFRHVSNRHRPVRKPEDCRGFRIRLQPNWAHEQYFRALGAEPVTTDLRDGIAQLLAGELDAQENPFANFETYGIHKVHPHVSLTGHVYGARGVYASAAQLSEWTDDEIAVLKHAVAKAITRQRREASEKERELREQLAASGTQIVELDEEQLRAFREIAKPVLDEARGHFGEDLFGLVDE
jgi:TRAP-type transport system periplasmic protein